MPSRQSLRPACFGLLVLAILGQSARGQATIEPSDPYTGVATAVGQLIEHELRAKRIPAISVALVDDQTIVWARGFGWADPAKKILADAETVYRVGSVSKLFTDIAIMQEVERGALDLDAPIETYLPEFQPRNPFHKSITLRQMMTHRSGLVRESPVGHYFDPTVPSLAATVRSMNETELVYEPETRTKYSNAAIATVGYVLEKMRGEPFAGYIQRAVLDAIGMRNSSYVLTPRLERKLASARMWTYDGRTFDAPTFTLAMAPAGNLYSTVTDLGRFLTVLFAGGKVPGGQILKADTLQQMYQPQLARAGQTGGFGLGFALGNSGGHRRVGHGGAVYGFATEVAALPDDKLGVIVAASKDSANGTARTIAAFALDALLAARAGKPLPAVTTTQPTNADADRLAGSYDNGTTIERAARGGSLRLSKRDGGSLLELRRSGDELVVDDCLMVGHPVIAHAGNVVGAKRVESSRPEPIPERWSGLIGEYGWDHDVLYILEKGGKLHALIEWFEFDPLEEISPDVFAFPKSGLYDGEKLIFTRDASGRATRVNAANVTFVRRPLPGEDGKPFRITPLRPVAVLRTQALAANPPRESGEFRKVDLVELTTLDPTIKLDIRYASDNNFLGTPLYTTPRAFLQRPAALALVRAHRALAKRGYGLLIHDAYRPWHVTKMFWDATPPAQHNFVADPAQGSKHNRGCAVDLTLYDLETGKPVPMVGGYDEFSDRSNPDYPGGTSRQRWHRQLLRDALENQGFSVNEFEWWHFDFRDWSHYPITNQSFDQLERP